MKALTLQQPWATLVAIGAKRYETRGWTTSHRGHVAIHAGKSFPRCAVERCIHDPIVRRALLLGGIREYHELPRGAVIAIARIVDCLPTSELVAAGLSKRQRTFGDYGPGRWAWQLADVQLLAEPEPAQGALGLWNWPT
jgi:activating signal cointegrator 1